MKRYLLDALVVISVFALCLLGREAYVTWTKVNALMAWASAQAQTQQQRPASEPTPQVKQ